MTDKEIIIDGVNVAGCAFICVEDDYCSYTGITRAYKGQCGCSDEEMCKDFPKCFYKKVLKQLQRKEQELLKCHSELVSYKRLWNICFSLREIDKLTEFKDAKEKRKVNKMTTKQEMQEQAKKLQEESDKLNKQIDSMPDKVVPRRWRAEDKKFFWYVGSDGCILNSLDHRTNDDDKRYSLGNYFKTKEEAEEYRDNLLTKQKLKDLALRLNKGVKIDWNNDSQIKRAMSYKEISNELYSTTWCEPRYIGAVYCLDANFLNIAKREIGEDKLIKLIKEEFNCFKSR